MNYHAVIYLLFILFITSCGKEKETKKYFISLENPSNIARFEEPITIDKSKILGILDSLGNNQTPVLLDSLGTIIPFQLDDTDQDGLWDEFNTVLDFNAAQKRSLELTTIPTSEVPSFKHYTNIRFGIGTSKKNVKEVLHYKREGDPRKKDSLFFQMEGPAWENDKIGFRLYFDPRNGIDIFGKTTSNMVLDQVGLQGNYHELENWGMDILKVGNSLGAGAIAIKHNDTLTRVTGITATKFKIIKEGPIKSVFEMVYKKEKIGKQTLDITNRISIWKGQWGYKSEVFFSGISEKTQLVSGIVNLKPNEMSTSITDASFSLKSYGKQSENDDFMGMAIVIENQNYSSHEEAPSEGDGVTKTYTLTMTATKEKPSTYYFLSGWEKSDAQFKTKQGFDQMVYQMTQRIEKPIIIK